MIEIDDIIELKTDRETERLSFATRYLVQINFTFDLTVVSGGFSGTAHFCVTRDQIAKMCADLETMNRALSGNTTLEDNDSDASVNFQVNADGQVTVFGQVGGSHEENFLKFSFQTDQTCLEPFLTDFQKLLKNEEPLNYYQVVDLILWKDWDPIGINDIEDIRDEYQGYTVQIWGLAIQGAGKSEIAQYLYKIETDNMGLPGNKIRCAEIAQKIVEAKGEQKNLPES